MEDYLRSWRQAATNRRQYETAIFIGDKLLALTSNQHDALRLAELHFLTGNYTRAQSLLVDRDLVSRNEECRHLAASCCIKQGRFDDALEVLGDKNPIHLISNPTSRKAARMTMQSRASAHSRADSHGKHGGTDRAPYANEEEMAHIRNQAAMCHLRGICYAKNNAFDRAKECYKSAVQIDVRCFEAFEQLMKNSLMTPDEEWEFLESLDFDSISNQTPIGDARLKVQEVEEMTRMLYLTRLSKYKKPTAIMEAIETLDTHYKLSTNADLMLSKAELYFAQCRFNDALSLTTMIMENDRYNIAALPVHVACLYELNEKNALFLLAHTLADHRPEEPATWLAVGVYYISIGKIVEARRFFSKSSIMDPHFGPAWIGFAHTFAAEGEHDQAISAYATAARLFQGTHMPQLFLGMQNLQLQNITLAHEYLSSAYMTCQTDPLLLNELGVCSFYEGSMQNAVVHFQQAVDIARQNGSDPSTCVSPLINLGHAFRRLELWSEALTRFNDALREGGRDAGVFCAKGMVLMQSGEYDAAVVALNQALAINPQDPVANELLEKAFHESATLTIEMEDPDDEFEAAIAGKRMEAGATVGKRHRSRRNKAVEQRADVGDQMDISET